MVIVVCVAVMQPPGTVPIDGRRCVCVAVMHPPGTVPIDGHRCVCSCDAASRHCSY